MEYCGESNQRHHQQPPQGRGEGITTSERGDSKSRNLQAIAQDANHSSAVKIIRKDWNFQTNTDMSQKSDKKGR